MKRVKNQTKKGQEKGTCLGQPNARSNNSRLKGLAALNKTIENTNTVEVLLNTISKYEIYQ